MIGCIRCGHWHTDAEEVMGRRLSCTEVREFWSRIRKAHYRMHGHRAQLTRDDSGSWICHYCKRRIFDEQQGSWEESGPD
jgi:hypothetical protein